MRAPTLLLLGSGSPPHVPAAVEAVDAAIPESRISVLKGQGHYAHLMDPELLAREGIAFLAAP